MRAGARVAEAKALSICVATIPLLRRAPEAQTARITHTPLRANAEQ
jgi:hypothetical protein